MSNKKLIINHKRAKGEDGYKTFSIRIKEELVGKIEQIAIQTGYSRNELIAQFLEYAVNNCIVSND